MTSLTRSQAHLLLISHDHSSIKIISPVNHMIFYVITSYYLFTIISQFYVDRYLLKKGADCKLLNACGDLPIHLAVKFALSGHKYGNNIVKININTQYY